MGDIKKVVTGGILILGGILVQGIPGVGSILGNILISAGIGYVRAGLFPPGSLESDLTFRNNQLGPEDPVPIVLGTRLIAPPIGDYQWRGSGNKFLYVRLDLCHAPDDGSGIEGVGQVYFNGEPVFDATGAIHGGFLTTAGVQSPYDGKVAWALHYGYGGQAVNPEMQQHFPGKYNTSCRGTGVAYLLLRLEADPEVFQGVPTITCVVSGLRLHDVRTDQVAFSRNPALCQRELLRSPVYGEGAPWWELDNLQDWVDEANHYDELVTVPDGAGGTTQQARYTCDAALPGDTRISQRAEIINSTSHAKLVFQGGKWRMHARREATPILTLDDSHFVGARKYKLAGLKEGGANSVNASYPDRTRNWASSVAEFPAAGQPNPYLAADNDRPAEKSLQMPATTDAYRAQAMCRMVLLELREADVLVATMREEAWELCIGNLVYVDLPLVGPDPVPFWVDVVGLRQDEQFTAVFLRYNPDAYDDAAAAAALVEQPAEPAPNVPSRRDVVGATGLAVSATVACSGGQAEAELTATWTPSQSAFITEQYLRYRQVAWGASGWVVLGPLAADQAEHTFRVPLSGTDYEVEQIEFNTYGYGPTVGLLTYVRSHLASYDEWPQSITVDLSTATRTAPSAAGVGITLEDRGLGVRATVDTAGGVGSTWVLHASATAGFTPGPATEVGRRTDVTPGEVLVYDFLSPAGPNATYYVRVCASDCLTVPLGEAASCSPEASAVWGGIQVGGGTGVLSSCHNLAGADAAEEWCVSGAGEIRGHEYAAIDLGEACLAPGDYFSIRAQGKVGAGADVLELNPAQDFALITSGLYVMDSFPGTSLGADWVADMGGSALSVAGGDLVSTGANTWLRWTGSPSSLTLPADEMQVAILASWNADGSFDNRRDWLPVAGAIMSTTPWDTAIFTHAQVFFGDKWNFGAYEGGVFQAYASPQVGQHANRWYGIRVTPGGATNTIRAAGSAINWTLSTTDAGNFGVAGYPGIISFQGFAGFGEGLSIHEMHAWEKPAVRITNVPAGTTVDIVQDAKPHTGPSTKSQFYAGGGTVDLTVYDGNNAMPPFDRVVLRQGSTELSRIEPLQKVYGGDVYEYLPVLANDCVSTIRLEFLDALGQVIGHVQAPGVSSTLYSEFIYECIQIPEGTASIRPVQYKLGANNCTDVCVQKLMVNPGCVAAKYTPPLGASLDLGSVPDTATRVAVTPAEQAQIQYGGTNLLPWAGTVPGGQLMGIGEQESLAVRGRLDSLGLEQGARLSFGAEVQSSAGADQLRAVVRFLDAAEAVVATSQGTAVQAASWAVARVEDVSVPAGATYVELLLENVDGTESWEVAEQALNRGPLALAWEPSPLHPGESTAAADHADFTHDRFVTVDVSSDATITVGGLARGVDYWLRVRIAGGSGHAITVAGVRWSEGPEPTYDTAADGETILHLVRLGDTVYGRLWGKAFADGSLSIAPPPGAASWDGFRPDVLRDLEPGLAAVLWESFPPELGPELVPGGGGAEWEGFQPLVEVQVLVPAGGASWDGNAPDLPVEQQGQLGSATWGGFAPTVEAT